MKKKHPSSFFPSSKKYIHILNQIAVLVKFLWKFGSLVTDEVFRCYDQTLSALTNAFSRENNTIGNLYKFMFPS